MADSLLLGLMSGTSMDAIDAALLRIEDGGMQLLQTLEHPLPVATRAAIADLCHSGNDEIERLGPLDRELGELFAEASLALINQAGIQAEQVRAIGSHGQTIRHHPPSSAPRGQVFTLQIGDPNTIAEITGITTVADFRRRDVAAGGEGAPLAPAFHAAAFTAPDVPRAIINIGGIANITLLQAGEVLGFDTGPGNTLLDLWANRQRGTRFDNNGEWAATGLVHADLLQRLLQHDYLKLQPPKSTGKEAFNLHWLDQVIRDFLEGEVAAADVQATLAEFTAITICNCVPDTVTEIYVCGGGAANGDLMARIQKHSPRTPVATTDQLGIHPDWVEAAAFAWLAHQCLQGLAGNLPSVTGALGNRVLGAIFPAGASTA
jgi:anhydro-N-acetylmuramic acid kinase